MKSLSAILMAAVFCAIPSAAATADTARVDGGIVKGAASGGVAVFKGIPFAAPPVGDLRWRPPQPAAAWTGVRQATQYGADCMQLPFPSDAAPLGTPPAEDCLYMNVWTPAHAAGERLPVMVWIYGGGFVNGGSSPAVYDGAQFAEHGVVFVSFNYRVGRFGFFAFPALTVEESRRPSATTPTWIRSRRSSGCSTTSRVWRRSAGCDGFWRIGRRRSVLTLMTSPITGGLFQKAIIESGGGRTLMGKRQLHESSPGQPSAEDLGIAFAKKNGIEGTDAAALANCARSPRTRSSTD